MSNAPQLDLMKIKPGAPASAISRTGIQYINDVLRDLVVRNGRLLINGSRWTIECGGVQPDWSFKVSLSGTTITVAAGYRCVIDTPWEGVAESTHSYTGSGVVYMVRYYPILNEDNEIVTPGYWEATTFGTPPANDTTKHVVRLASITDRRIIHENLGNVTVTDWGDC